MFTRSSSVEPKTPPHAPKVQRSVTPPSSGEKSFIGNDLKIVGQGLKIIGRGMLQIDGDIEGDVQAPEVIVWEKGRVTGMVAGQQVIVRGTVLGVICGQTVALQSSCHVESDVHHLSLLIEQGAHFHGHSRRARSEADLVTVLEGRNTVPAEPAALLALSRG
jgi:cytoskeletal protein CcmA (bactofilin family)